VQDLVFGKDSIKCRTIQYVAQRYCCRSCGYEYGQNDLRLHGRNWGWNILAYFVYHIVGLRIPQLTVQHSMNRLFGCNLSRGTLHDFKCATAQYYSVTKEGILDRLVRGDLIHADETRANIKGHLAYVWVLTNLKEVVYILAESREGEIIQELLKDFHGVLVSDFYAAYDSINCPQQKCLIHLMRDLNDTLLDNPFDIEMRSIAVGFAGVWSAAFVAMTLLRLPATPLVAGAGFLAWIAYRFAVALASQAGWPLAVDLWAEAVLAAGFCGYMADGVRPNAYYRRRLPAP